jgi:hypothetical protein
MEPVGSVRRILIRQNLLLALTSLREERLLACNACRANVGVLGPCAQAGEKRIRLQRWVRAVVPVDGVPQQLESGLGLAAVGEVGGGEVIQFGIV